MQVIFEDNHLLAAVKPAGLSTQPHETDPDNFLDRAKKWIKVKYKKAGNVFLEPVHRLDKPVSGIVLFARTSKALSRLQAAMRDKEISKTYVALIDGSLFSEEGTLDNYLLHDDHRATIVSPANTKGKRAILHYKVLSFEKGKSLVEITLETGRYHQIRAQFAHAGFPIIGDKKYGSRQPWKGGKEENAIALQHVRMKLKHPVTLQELDLENRFLNFL